jgi:hypothetical protein
MKKTAQAVKKPAGPIETSVGKITAYENRSKQWLSEELGYDKTYLNSQIALERAGKKTSGNLPGVLKDRYEATLTGKKDIVVDVETINQTLFEQITRLEVALKVLRTEVIDLRSKLNGTTYAREELNLTKTEREAAEQRLNAM